jgi:hypothetical protein
MRPVPLDSLPPELRAQVKPGTPAFTAYAKLFEAEMGLPLGSLTNARFVDLAPGTDYLGVLRKAAMDQKADPIGPKAPRPVPHELLPPGASGAAGAPTPKPGGGKRTTPGEPEYNPAKGAYQDVGPFGLNLSEGAGNAAAAFGKSVMDTVRGTGQLIAPFWDAHAKTYNKLTGDNATMPSQALGLTAGDADIVKERDLPLMGTAEGMMGNMTGIVAQSAVPSSRVAKGAQAIEAAAREGRKGAVALNRMLPTGQTGQGALVGGGFNLTQPVGSDETRGTNVGLGVIGGGAGGGISGALQGLFRPAGETATKAVRDLADRAHAMGIDLRAAQVSDSPWLRWATTALDHLPFNNNHAFSEAQHKQFNKVISRTMGESSDDAGHALKEARKNLSKVYDDVKAKYDLQVEPWHVDELKHILKTFMPKDTTPSQAQSTQLKALMRSIVNRTDPQGVITGLEYKSLRSKIGEMANKAEDPEFRMALKEYQAVLDRAFKSGLTPEDAKLIDLNDKQWGNMRVFEDIAPKNAGDDFDFNGLSRVMTARGQKNAANRHAYHYGLGDQTLPDIGKIGSQFLSKGPHGGINPTRPLNNLGRAVVTGTEIGALGGGLYALNHGEDDDPVMQTGMELGGLLLAAKGLGKAGNSKWFSRGWTPGRAAATGARDAGLAQLPTAWIDAEKAGVPVDPYGP